MKYYFLFCTYFSNTSKRFETLSIKLKETVINENKKVIGKTEQVLVDSIEKNIASGKSHTGRTVKFPIGEKGMRFMGEIIPVHIVDVENWSLIGEIV